MSESKIKLCFRILFGVGAVEIIRCKECKSFNITMKIRKMKGKYRKWYLCKKCGRNFWTEEKLYDGRPRWFPKENLK